jgi:hypothetical protein
MSVTEINDRREAKEFAGITFSKFQKSKVKRELLACLVAGKVEAACYWSAEYACAGHYSELWDIIILYMSKHVHLGNPKLPIYIESRFESFKAIVHNGYLDNELAMRNNVKIRHIFAELISVLCFSRKKHVFETVKINKAEEFDIALMATKLKAPELGFAEKTFRPGDPKELFIAMNEFAYHISPKSKHAIQACYWFEWIIEFESMCKRNNNACSCLRRHFAPVGEKWQMLPVWLIWDALRYEITLRKRPLLTKIFDALVANFSIRFSSGVPKRRRYLVYFAISLLCETVDYSVDLISDSKHVETVVTKVDEVYKDVKKNEIAPATEYLFHGVTPGTRSNLDKTIERLEKMNEVM